MSHWKGLLVACLITLGITLLLSALPLANGHAPGKSGDVSVFRPVKVKRLSSDTIVDSMLGLQLSLNVKRVAWNGSVLTVDLSNGEYGNADDRWMSDLQRLFEFAFVRTDNVSRVLVRLVAPLQPDAEDARGDARMLAAVDVRRSDAWLSTELSNLSAAKPFEDETWRRRLRLSDSRL